MLDVVAMLSCLGPPALTRDCVRRCRYCVCCQMPEHELCSVGLPETYLGSIDALRTAVEASTTGSVQFHRPDDADKPGLDATCGDLGRYMTFESSAGVTFDVSACSPTTRTVDLPGGANSTVIRTSTCLSPRSRSS